MRFVNVYTNLVQIAYFCIQPKNWVKRKTLRENVPKL